jgi:hypothetical protein
MLGVIRLEVIMVRPYFSGVEAGAPPFWLPHPAGAAGRIGA